MTGAASGLLLLKSKTAFGYQANSAVRLGLLGCGGRGTAVATSFARNTTAHVIALADIFPNQAATARTHFDELNASLGKPPIDPQLIFHGPDAFQELAHTHGIDMVQISTPPWFHVEHLAAAVAGGKHVYCEKPMGVDIAQTRQAMEIARRVARDGKLSVDVGFQVRSAPPIAAIMERIKAGAIGQIASITAYYNAPASKEHVPPGITPGEHRLRNWLWDRALSGDILVEQNIHIIDLCNLALGAHPLKAMATGGRTIVHHAGNCWDNYQVNYTYPGVRGIKEQGIKEQAADGQRAEDHRANGQRGSARGSEVHVSFSSTQFGESSFDAGLSLFGSEGRADAPYTGAIKITGSQPWAWTEPAVRGASSSGSAAPRSGFAANGDFEDNLALADREKDRSFIESITSGRFHNQIATGVETAQSCMLGRMAGLLGRMAGLTGRTVTWEDLLAHGETYPLGMNLNQFKT